MELNQRLFLIGGSIGVVTGTSLWMGYISFGETYYLIRGSFHLLFGIILMPFIKVSQAIKMFFLAGIILLLFLSV